MDQQNVARKEINDFHKKSGNNQAPAMNKREKVSYINNGALKCTFPNFFHFLE